MPQPRDLPPSLSDEARDAIKGYQDIDRQQDDGGLLIVRNPEGPGYVAFIEKDVDEQKGEPHDMGRVAIDDVETFRLPHSQGDGHDAEA